MYRKLYKKILLFEEITAKSNYYPSCLMILYDFYKLFAILIA